MKRHRGVAVFAGLAIALAVLARPEAGWARDDFQVWGTVELKKRLGPTWELFFLPEIRIRHDAGQLFYHEYRQGIRWKPSKHLQIGLNYLFARNAASGKPLEEHTGELDVTPKATLGPLDLSMRGRLAMRTIQGSSGEQEWQLRLMPRIAYPLKLRGAYTITPYVAHDAFYDYTADAWNQHRTFLGMTVPVGKLLGVQVQMEGYYMMQNLRSPRKDWNTNHVLGTKLILQF